MLKHHVVKVFIVHGRDEGIEVLARESVLEVNVGTNNGGELGSKLDVAIDGKDHGVGDLFA